MKSVLKVLAAIVFPALMLMSACGQPAPGSPTDSTPGPVSQFYEYGDEQTVKVIEINGRVCYLYDGQQSGGIWCES